MSYQPPSTSSRNAFKRNISPKPADLLSSDSFPSLSGKCADPASNSNSKWFARKESASILVKKTKPDVLVCKAGWAFISSSGVSGYHTSEHEDSIRQIEISTDKWRMSRYHNEEIRDKEDLMKEYGDYRTLGQELFELEMEREYEDSDVESDYSSDSNDELSTTSDYDY